VAAGSPCTIAELLALGFGLSRFYFAAPLRVASIANLDGKRVATSLSVLVAEATIKAGIHIEIVEFDEWQGPS
jgi:ATP phosphoribosyltransferase